MASLKSYPSGAFYGVAGGRPACRWEADCCLMADCCRRRGRTLCCIHGPAKRGEVAGWSRSMIRRYRAWLYSIDVSQLDGQGDAVTLTLRDIPESHEDWIRVTTAFKRRLDRMDLLRWCWVVEWQKRGAPHLHLAVYARTDNGHYVKQGCASPLGPPWTSSAPGTSPLPVP